MFGTGLFKSRGRAGTWAVALAAAAGLSLSLPLAPLPVMADDVSIPPPDCKNNKPECYKEVRVVNNMKTPIYVVIQGSKQQAEALGGCKKGDKWLQRALSDTKNCHPVNNDYYAYINPVRGIKPGETVSVLLPFYSMPKKTRGSSLLADFTLDDYIDWWRAGRIYIFDDNDALAESYNVNAGRRNDPLAFQSGSPLVQCTTSTPPGPAFTNVCASKELAVFRALDDVAGSRIQDHTPFQLNEWTFADVTDVAKGGNLISLNVNYNVSNVDQVYLPVAVQAITPGFTIGYLGTTLSVEEFRSAMAAFVGPKTGSRRYNWPIYNNPVVTINNKARRKYLVAGIRLPSPLGAFNFYMNPSYIDGNNGQNNLPYQPTMISSTRPAPTDPRPIYLQNIVDNWARCTSSGATSRTCPKYFLYRPIKSAFDYSYQQYLKNCWKGEGNSPPFMAPARNNDLTSPPKSIDMLLRFVHGWVPTRIGNIKGPKIDCTVEDVPELPLVSDPPFPITATNPRGWGASIVNYMNIQYDWATWGLKQPQLFNPYTQFIHDKRQNGGLAAASYAFSIDDHASFRGDPGSGLIFSVGGVKGLPNPKAAPPPLPQKYDWYTASLNLGAPYIGAKRSDRWTNYSLCSGPLNEFPNATGGYIIGLDPTTITVPCTIVLQATSTDLVTKKVTNKNIQIVLTQMNSRGEPPYAIWPKKTSLTGFDPTIMSCSGDADFCKQINQRAIPYDSRKPSQFPIYEITTPTPFPLPPPTTTAR